MSPGHSQSSTELIGGILQVLDLKSVRQKRLIEIESPTKLEQRREQCEIEIVVMNVSIVGPVLLMKPMVGVLWQSS
ncbi:hypothetical protein XH93_10805 [Bradyrhizobium sp. CCBAU 51753]|nr:hypothetical protein XH93_10805 [Bradyrhizobium sp. CCBAU 51753]